MVSINLTIVSVSILSINTVSISNISISMISTDFSIVSICIVSIRIISISIASISIVSISIVSFSGLWDQSTSFETVSCCELELWLFKGQPIGRQHGRGLTKYNSSLLAEPCWPPMYTYQISR